ncbi:hypothetical protein Bca101_042627 [Brassica carinata]
MKLSIWIYLFIDEIAKLFPGLYGQPSVLVVPDQSAASSGEKLKIGVVLSGGQAPGGHNVISGLFYCFELTSGSCRKGLSSSARSYPSSPVLQASGPAAAQPSSSSHGLNNYSPIFLQVDCVSQLMRMYPCAFSLLRYTFLVDFMDCLLSCRFGNFLRNSEKERQECRISEACGCIWAYLTDLRSCSGTSHAHCHRLDDSSHPSASATSGSSIASCSAVAFSSPPPLLSPLAPSENAFPGMTSVSTAVDS